MRNLFDEYGLFIFYAVTFIAVSEVFKDFICSSSLKELIMKGLMS